MKRGHTLLELIAVLLLLSLASSMLFSALGRLRDAMAVSAAREAVAGLLAEARVLAVARGGATVFVRAAPWRAWTEVADSVVRVVDLERDLQVSVRLPRERRSLGLRYDALGLGQVASQTLGFERGTAARALVVSGYGRVRRP